jgi:hypothetical protein
VENLNDRKNISRTLKNIKDDIKTSAEESQGLYELKHDLIKNVFDF